jgi:hypothetical protein
VTLLREGACISSILADDWDDWFELAVVRFMQLRDCPTKRHTEVQEGDHACHVRDNRISGTQKGEIAGGKPADGDIT